MHYWIIFINFAFGITKDELAARLRDIEWDDFEVKAAKFDLPKNIRETVSAFSNCSGGWIVLGVKQSGHILYKVSSPKKIDILLIASMSMANWIT